MRREFIAPDYLGFDPNGAFVEPSFQEPSYRDLALQQEMVAGEELLGQVAASFWYRFIVNNIPIITQGALDWYETAGTQHKTVSIGGRPVTYGDEWAPWVCDGLKRIEKGIIPEGETAAVSASFGLNPGLPNIVKDFEKTRREWNGFLPYKSGLGAGLLAIDLEAPATREFLDQLIEVFGVSDIPVVIFNTYGSFFAVCLDKAYTEDYKLAQSYGRIVEAIVGKVEPGELSWAEPILKALQTCQRGEDLFGTTKYIFEKIGHWGEPHSLCVDLRHLSRACLTNSLNRNPYLYCSDYQPLLNLNLFMRVGPKRSRTDFPYVVYASSEIPFLLGKTIPLCGRTRFLDENQS